jgi:hypothetical protein
MSLIVIETVREGRLITDGFLYDSAEPLLSCLAARDAHWQYSLLATDRTRMLCIYDAPDLSAVQDSYRKTNVEFSRMWVADHRTPIENPPLRNESILKVFESTYPEGFTDSQWDEASRQLLPCYTLEGIEWVQTYISRDRTRMACELNAPDAEVIREAHRRFNLPFDRVWAAMVLKP